MERSRVVQHWDHVSTYYDSEAMGLIDGRLWDILCQDEVVSSKVEVLDIGCGTGSLTERFASLGGRVVGLDISPGMLSVARERCAPWKNVELTCQDWACFSGAKEFDLVFSSFCPAVDGLGSILRMEALSRGECCLVSIGGRSGDRLAFDIWEELGHGGLSMEGFDPLFPYFVLKDMGRRPVLKSFDVCEESQISRADMVEHLVSYFGLFHDVTPEVQRVVEDAVSNRVRDDRLTLVEERTVSVLRWSPSGLSGRTIS